ncbi:hypothetical protein EDB81DRAFT_910010 [Dactylonectria macrodidyma]|uniref:Apple domain-containing protein n=1 Tax=Dactylonectria macrodidyma TaxID=307937 RepID=A0A9P9FQK7_9HYPO|nr:hypothetical protein EDB81DRAFT_910010 [Dactylonectria macrodidyma]
MVSSTLVALLSAFSLTGVEASRCKGRPTASVSTTLTTSVRATSLAASTPSAPVSLGSSSGANTCKASYHDSGRTCNAKGHLQNPSGSESSEKTFDDCVESCAATNSCVVFSYGDGVCTTYVSGSFRKLGFRESDSTEYWYELGCFECYEGETILNLDFEDGSGDDWNFQSTPDYALMSDIQTPYDGRGKMTKALRIIEAVDAGYGTADYAPEITLEEGAIYMFYATTRKTGANSDWQKVSITLTTGSQHFFKVAPNDKNPLGDNGWSQLSKEFEVAQGQGGPANLYITVESVNSESDYYFDNIMILKL